MMDHDTDGDGAINLSTSQRPSASTTPNGDAPIYGQDQQNNDQVFPLDERVSSCSRWVVSGSEMVFLGFVLRRVFVCLRDKITNEGIERYSQELQLVLTTTNLAQHL